MEIRGSETVSGQTIDFLDAGSATESVTYALRRQANGRYLFHGDQRLLNFNIDSTFQITHDSSHTTTPTADGALNVFASALAGQITSVTLNGILPPTASAQTVTLARTTSGGEDLFGVPGAAGFNLPGFVTAGAEYRLDVQPAAGSPVTFTSVLGASTNEVIRVTHVHVTLTASAAATVTSAALPIDQFYAQFTSATQLQDRRVTLFFERPATFTLLKIDPFGSLNNSAFIDSTPRFPDVATNRVTFLVPTNLPGTSTPVTAVSFSIDFKGPNDLRVSLTLLR